MDVMEIFIEQLRGLLGVNPVRVRSASQLLPEGVSVEVETSREGVTQFELDRLLRSSTIQNLLDAVATLTSLANLLESMENMVVLPHIQSQVEWSLACVKRAHDDLREGRYTDAFLQSKEALQEAEDAFFDPTMVSLLYFPDEHRYAVYMPFFTPVAGKFVCFFFSRPCGYCVVAAFSG
jgi:phosphatidylinositol glycan class S